MSIKPEVETILSKVESELDKKLKIEENAEPNSKNLNNVQVEVDDDDDDDDDQPEESPVLKIMIEKHEAIEKTVLLLKKEINNSQAIGVGSGEEVAKKDDALGPVAEPVASTKSSVAPKPVKEEFDQLNNLLSDNKVKDLIRVVGVDTQSVIDRAMGAINSSKSLEDKRTALSHGLRNLQMNLRAKKDVDRDPNYNLAMNLVGLKQQALGKRF